MNVNQLSAAQLEELAANHLCEHYDEYSPDPSDGTAPSWGELAAALEIVGRDTLINEYADIDFVPEDFTAQPKPEHRAITFEVREVDAWADDESGWTYNTTYSLGNFVTTAKDERRAFYRALNRLGIRFHRGAVRAVDDGSIIEIVDRKTAEPLFCAIPQEV